MWLWLRAGRRFAKLVAEAGGPTPPTMQSVMDEGPLATWSASLQVEELVAAQAEAGDYGDEGRRLFTAERNARRAFFLSLPVGFVTSVILSIIANQIAGTTSTRIAGGPLIAAVVIVGVVMVGLYTWGVIRQIRAGADWRWLVGQVALLAFVLAVSWFAWVRLLS
jgi:hypothetical protein